MRPRRRGGGPRRRQRLLRPGAEGGPPRRARAHRRRDRRAPTSSAAATSPTAPAVEAVFADHRFERVIHLAAQAGVRYSLENPLAYVAVQRRRLHSHPRGLPRTPRSGTSSTPRPRASTAPTQAMPFTEAQGVDHPLHALRRHQAGQRADGACLQPPLRPADHRPALLHRLRPLGPARHGADARSPAPSSRAGRSRSTARAGRAATSPMSTTSSRGCCAPPTGWPTPDPDWDPARPDPATSNAPFRIYNIGNSAPVELGDFIPSSKPALGKPAIRELLPMQPGDVRDTYADLDPAGAGGELAPGDPDRRKAWPASSTGTATITARSAGLRDARRLNGRTMPQESADDRRESPSSPPSEPGSSAMARRPRADAHRRVPVRPGGRADRYRHDRLRRSQLARRGHWPAWRLSGTIIIPVNDTMIISRAKSAGGAP